MFGNQGGFGGGMFGQDPFFGNAFAHMDRMMQAAFSDPFFTGGLHPQAQGQPGNVRGARAQRANSQPIIEELHPEDPLHRPGTGTSSQPIVEEPDDDDPAVREAQRQRRSSPQRSPSAHRPRAGSAPVAAGPPAMPGPFAGHSLFNSILGGGFPNLANMPAGGNSYCYSSSTFTSSNGNGVTYQATHTSRMGPGGVRESQSTVRDGRTGQQTITVARGLGDKERVLTRSRDATGRETANDVLRGINHEEADRFDQEWQTHAERNLLGAGAGHLGYGGGAAGAGARAGARAAAPPQHYALPPASGTAAGYGAGATGRHGGGYAGSAYGGNAAPGYTGRYA